MDVPNLDYAFLADYARVQPDGTLTAVGASYTEVHVARLPTPHEVTLAGRVRAAEGSDHVPVAVTFRGPDQRTAHLRIEGQLGTAGARAYQGRIGLLFSLKLGVGLMSEGLHWVTLEIEGRTVRELAFEVTAEQTEP